MGWAEERASEIVEQMRSERPSLTIGRQEEIIAAALQKVAVILIIALLALLVAAMAVKR